MRHLLVILMFLLCVQLSLGDLIDPTDLFNYDEMNAKLSNKAPDRNNGQEPDKSCDGKPGASESLPSSSKVVDEEPASKTEDTGDKKPEFSGSLQSPASKVGEQGGGKDVQEPILRCKDETLTKAVFTLFQQFVMNFVHLSQGMIDDPNHPAEFCMRIRATKHDMSVLRKFGQGDDSAVHDAHERLTHLLQSTCPLPTFSRVFWLENKLGLSVTKLSLIVASLLILFFIVKSLTTIRMTASRIWFAVTAVFTTSVAFTWVEMYQKKVANQERVLTDEISTRCPQYEKLNAWERFTNFLSSSVTFQDENCREFYEAMFINPIAQVSPVEAMAVAVVKTVVAPCKIIGEGIKDLFIGLFKDLPAQYAGYLMFLMTAAVLVVFLYIPLLAFRCKIRIPFLLTIEPAAMGEVEPKPVAGEVQGKEAIQAREEKGQGDAVQHPNTIMPSAPREPYSRNLVDKASSPFSSIRSEILSSQTRAFQKCQVNTEQNNDLSKGPRDRTTVDSRPSLPMDRKKGEEKGTDLVVRCEPTSHEENLSNSRKDSVPEAVNFVNVQPDDCMESFIELVSNDFNTASEVENSGNEDGNVDEPSEEDNFNVASECSVKSYEKNLEKLNDRGN